MAQVGIVYYAKDPQRRVFRIVCPSDPTHLDGPALHTHHGKNTLHVMLDEQGKPHGWHTFGTKPELQPTFEKVDANDPRAQRTYGLVNIEQELLK